MEESESQRNWKSMLEIISKTLTPPATHMLPPATRHPRGLYVRWKSSSVRSTPTARDIAIKWRTALVEPPVAITIVIAFSNASFVIMSEGLMCFSSKLSLCNTQLHVVRNES